MPAPPAAPLPQDQPEPGPTLNPLRNVHHQPDVPPRRQPFWLAALLVLAQGLGCLVIAALPAAAATTPTGVRDIEQLFRRGDAASAWQRLDSALGAEPGHAGLRFLKGVMLNEANRAAEAAEVFERMTQDFPDLPEPYNNLAVLRAADGRLDQARALLEAALRQDPQYRTAHENLGDVLVRLAERAYQAASTGTTVDPSLQRKLRLVREFIGAGR